MELNCKILFSGLPKGISLRETTSFDVLIVKIGAGVLVLEKSLGVPDLITHAKFGGYRFGGFGDSGRSNFTLFQLH